MPSKKSFSAILHIRDFIKHVEPDSTRPGKGLLMQLRVSPIIPDNISNKTMLNMMTF
jgi:hypothetical protein